jgi:DNA-binding NarL/FixJ family response regulator
MQFNVALVEDHALVRKGLRLLVESLSEFTVLLEAENGEEFIGMLDDSPVKPDIILMDVSMPVMDGLEATKIISRKYPNIKIVALSVHDDMKTVEAMIDAGAHNYLYKSSSPGLFLSVLRAVSKTQIN